MVTILVFVLIGIQIIGGNITKGKYYISFAEPRFAVQNFQDAEEICNSFSSNLASIHNEQEMMDVVSIIKNVSYGHHYIGYYINTDVFSGKWLEWSWTDGSANKYENWGFEEPTKTGNALCAAITNKSGGKWRNILCNITHNDLLLDLYPFYPLCNYNSHNNISVSLNNSVYNDNDNSTDIILINDNPCPMTDCINTISNAYEKWTRADYEIVSVINETIKFSYIKFDIYNNKHVVLQINNSLHKPNASIYYNHLIKYGEQCKESVDEKRHERKLHYTINMAMDHINKYGNERSHLMVIFNDCQIPIQTSQLYNNICQYFDDKIKTNINYNLNDSKNMICLTKNDIKSIYNKSTNKSHHLHNIRPNIRRRLTTTTTSSPTRRRLSQPTPQPTPTPTAQTSAPTAQTSAPIAQTSEPTERPTTITAAPTITTPIPTAQTSAPTAQTSAPTPAPTDSSDSDSKESDSKESDSKV